MVDQKREVKSRAGEKRYVLIYLGLRRFELSRYRLYVICQNTLKNENQVYLI